MIRSYVKISVTILLILVGATAFWGSAVYFYATNVFAKRYASDINRLEPAMAQISTDKKGNQKQLEKAFAQFSQKHDIAVVDLVNDSLHKTLRLFAKPDSEWHIKVTYPVTQGAVRVAQLVLWIDSGVLVRDMVSDTNRYGVIAWLLGLWLLIIGALFFYVRSFLFAPMRALASFTDALERGEPEVRLSQKEFSDSGWHPLMTKLNRMSGRISDVNETLTILFNASKTLTSRLDINEIINVVLEAVQRKFNNASCAVMFLEDDGYLRIRNQRGLSPNFVRDLRLRPGESYAGAAFKKGSPVVLDDIEAAKSDVCALVLGQEGIRSFIHVPLMVEAKCVGVMSVHSLEPSYFTFDRAKTISTLAEYLSIALRNIQLYERIHELNRRLETEVSATTQELIQTNSRLIQKVREMKALTDIASFAASKVNLSEILEMVVEKIKDLLSAQSAGFFLYDDETDELVPHMPFFGVRDKDFSRLRFRLDESKVLGDVLHKRCRKVMNEPDNIRASLPLLSNLFSVQSLVLVPLASGKKYVGVLGVANKFGTVFSEDDIRVLELIADRISGIIENVRLYQELERRFHDLMTLQEISAAISSEPVWEETIKKVTYAATRAFNADLCALLFYDEKTNTLVTQPGAYFTGGDEAVLLRIPTDDANSVSATVFRTGEAFLSPDASIDPRIKSQTARMWDVRSLISVPLKSENRTVGVLRIGKHQANCYGKEHLNLATLIAHQAAIILENAHLYDSLREAKEELIELNQMKNEFISIVSHELRTPITSIKGFVKIVLQGEAGAVNEQQAKFLQIADQSIDRLTVLISDLLDISRIESGQFRLEVVPVDPSGIISEVIENMQPEVKRKGLALGSDLPKNLPGILVDRGRMVQAFENLVLNAIKFTPPGGKVTVSAEDKGDIVCFAVTDTGIGIDKKDHDRIFEKFYQVDSSPTRTATGAGLGLAIVKSIIEMHGGKIWVDSESGRGSSFQFLIPRSKNESVKLT